MTGPSPRHDLHVAPYVSVVIPVLNDAERLRRCLSALQSQSLQRPFEIIVVDNGSSDDVEEVVAQSHRTRFLREPQRSSYAARNRGARAARGEILAFTDSDCVPAPDWLARGTRRIEQAVSPAFVGGPVRTFSHNPMRPTAAELYESIHAFPQRRYIEHLSFSVTANLLVSRAVFEMAGGFNGSLASGGDWEWGQRARRAGVRAVYDADVSVGHPSRRTIAEMSRKNRRRYDGDARLRALGGAPGRPPMIRRLALPPVRSTARNLRFLRPASPRSIVLYAGARMLVHYIGIYQEAHAAVRATVGTHRTPPARAHPRV